MIVEYLFLPLCEVGVESGRYRKISLRKHSSRSLTLTERTPNISNKNPAHAIVMSSSSSSGAEVLTFCACCFAFIVRSTLLPQCAPIALAICRTS